MRVTYSIAANLTGCALAMARAAVSPTKIWMGVRTAPMVNGIANPSRWYRSRCPRRIPAAYTDATRNPVTM